MGEIGGNLGGNWGELEENWGEIDETGEASEITPALQAEWDTFWKLLTVGQ